MIVRSRLGGNVELRSEFGSWPVPRSWSTSLSSAGVPVTYDSAMGLPAVSSVIRSPAEIVASVPFMVYTSGDSRERAETSWQWSLLHELPNDEADTFQFFYDLELSIEASQNAFLQKVPGVGTRQRQLEALIVLDPRRVFARVEPETGRKLFDVYISPSEVRRNLTTDEILHIRGFCPDPGGAMGVSLIQWHRDPLGSSLAMQRFEGDFFRNSGLSPLVFNLGPSGTAEQAKELQDGWEDQHAGAGNQFKVGVVWGIEGMERVPLSLQDATFAEAKRLSVEDACRIWRWPKELLELTQGQQPIDAEWDSRFLKYYALPRFRRIERALAADRHVFRDWPLVGEFLTAALERASFVSRVRGYKDAIQGGWVTPNEVRRWENLPPSDDPRADELQQTPVGGAANEPLLDDGSETDEGEDADRVRNGRAEQLRAQEALATIR